MNDREKKLIMAAGIIAVLLVGQHFLFPMETAEIPSADAPPTTKIAVERATKELVAEAIERGHTYTIDAAERPVQGNPFEGGAILAQQGSGVVPDLVYSGFVGSPSTGMAVLNGLEYKVGEILEDGTYIVKAIDMGKVVLESLIDQSEREVFYAGPEL